MGEAIDHALREEKAFLLTLFAGKESVAFATLRMSSYINHNQLHVEFQNGESSFWPLPDPKGKAAIRTVLSKALEFASKQNASIGQLNAVRKTLTDGGYHLTK
ncbi:MAG: hypothetical protein NDI73_05365 [Desulfuromonadales bacterium]|nr:hypothetical protein [Desulfuromonadales bacterium]